MLQPDRRASARRVEAVWSRSRDTLLGGRVGAGHDGGSARSEGSGREGGDGVADDDEHVRRPPADEYLAWATLADGLRVAARFQKPHDAEALVAGFEHLSESSLVRRFLTPKDHLTTADLDQLVGSVDQVDHVALMLFWRRRDHDVLIGEGRFIRLPSTPEDAEVAVTIADEAQGMGAARFLTRLLADLALERGIVRFVADLLPYNEAARRLVCSVGEVEEDYIEDATRHLAVRILPSVESLRTPTP